MEIFGHILQSVKHISVSDMKNPYTILKKYINQSLFPLSLKYKYKGLNIDLIPVKYLTLFQVTTLLHTF